MGIYSLDSNIYTKISTRGLTFDNPATSAQELVSWGNQTDGVYYIDLPTVGVTPVYCLLNPIWNGGGWMLAMKAAATGTTFSYSSSYWTSDNTLNINDVTLNNADAKYEVMNKFAAKDIMAKWPDLGVSGSVSGSISGVPEWTWLENNFNNGTRQTLISFFNTPSNRSFASGGGGSGYFIKDAKTFDGRAVSGVTKFSSQADVRFYGFNYNGYNNTTQFRVRWGFGWNENGEGLFPGAVVQYSGTNDVVGGVGLDATGSNWSAGDFISCCQDSTGVNRQARVELYVR